MDLKEILARFSSTETVPDEDIYEIVGQEIENGTRHKALTEANWNESEAKAVYVRYRVAQIKKALSGQGSQTQTIGVQPPEAVSNYLGSAVKAYTFMRIHGLSDKQLHDAISRGRIRAYLYKDVLWVENKRPS